MNDSITTLFHLGEKSKVVLVPMCLGILKDLHTSTILRDLEGHESLASIEDALLSVKKMCLAIAHIFDAGEHDTSTSDVLVFSDYCGSDLFSKTIKGIFRQDGGFWKKQIDELLKKGATSAVLKPKLDEMKMHLAKLKELGTTEVTTEVMDLLIKAIQGFKELRGGIREVELRGVSSDLLAHIQNATKSCMDNKDKDLGNLNQTAMDVLMLGLDSFAQVPGVLSLLNEFKGWVMKHASMLCSNNLVIYVQNISSNSAPDFQEIKQIVGKISADNAEVVGGHAPALLRHMLDACLTQATARVKNNTIL